MNTCTERRRFGYPFAPHHEFEFDPSTNRAVYRCFELDGDVNPYCSYLLKLLGVSIGYPDHLYRPSHVLPCRIHE